MRLVMIIRTQGRSMSKPYLPLLLLGASLSFALGVTQPLMEIDRLYFFSATPSLIEITTGLWTAVTSYPSEARVPAARPVPQQMSSAFPYRAGGKFEATARISVSVAAYRPSS
jgi:hypothetical protein